MKKILIFSVAIAMLVCAGCGTTSNTAQKKVQLPQQKPPKKSFTKAPSPTQNTKRWTHLPQTFPKNSPALHNTSHRSLFWTAGNSGWDAPYTALCPTAVQIMH